MNPMLRTLPLVALVLGLSGCATMWDSLTSWIPSIPTPSFDWLTGGSKKPGPLPQLTPSATAQLQWQASVAKAAPGFAPAITKDAVYAAASNGTLTRLTRDTGRPTWSVSAGPSLSAGPGADNDVVVVGTDKGEVLAFGTADGKSRWTASVSSSINAPPLVSDGIVVVFSNDGRIYGLSVADGKTKWVNQRAMPPLSVRNTAGGVVFRGGLFVGVAGGRLLAIDIESGALGWDSAVANPKGATELERIADVTSLPLLIGRQACAVAFQGRLACFDVLRGTLTWSRDVSSLAGITGDERSLFITDETGAVQALDPANGASIWKQDVLASRRIGGPQLIGEFIGVVDIEGYLHLLSRGDGKYVGRFATDGKAATAQPERFDSALLWQSIAGNVYAVTAK